MARLVGIFEGLNRRLGFVWALLLIPLLICTVVEVVARYVFNHSQAWTYDLSLYLLPAIGLLGGAYTLMVGGHIKIDLIYQAFPARAKLIVDIITSLMSLAFCAVLTWQGWVFAWHALSEGTRQYFGMGWPIFPLRVMIPIGGFLVSVQFLCNIYHDVESLRALPRKNAGEV